MKRQRQRERAAKTQQHKGSKEKQMLMCRSSSCVIEHVEFKFSWHKETEAEAHPAWKVGGGTAGTSRRRAEHSCKEQNGIECIGLMLNRSCTCLSSFSTQQTIGRAQTTCALLQTGGPQHSGAPGQQRTRQRCAPSLTTHPLRNRAIKHASWQGRTSRRLQVTQME